MKINLQVINKVVYLNMKITNTQLHHINNRTLVTYIYSGCDCELLLEGELTKEEVLQKLSEQDETFHEDSQVVVDDRPVYYSENTYE